MHSRITHFGGNVMLIQVSKNICVRVCADTLQMLECVLFLGYFCALCVEDDKEGTKCKPIAMERLKLFDVEYVLGIVYGMYEG